MLWDKRADMLVHERDPFNAEPPRPVLAEGAVTSIDTHYVRNHGPVPEIAPEQWRLAVDGWLARPGQLSLAWLRTQFPVREVTAALQCAGNRRAGLMRVHDIPGETPWGPGATATASWVGVRLGDVLRAAGVADVGGLHVAFEGRDVSTIPAEPQRFGGSIPLRKALDHEVLLAWEMNGTALPPVHGGPVRVVVPGYVGARSVKWLDRITVQNHPSGNFFQAVSYRLLPPEVDPMTEEPGTGLALGPVALNSDILVPDDGDEVSAGATEVRGYAVAGDDRGVARVDVSCDGGRSWQQADLATPHSPWAWWFWRAIVDLPPGDVEITARAWDTTAAAQPEHERHLWNPKGYVNNAWARVHVRAR